MSIPLPRSTPEAQGIASAAIRNFIDIARATISELHSVMLLRHGVVVAEGWWSPYRADRPHSLFSVSKSFTSTAIGLAIAEGHLSLDDSVIGFFPDDLPAVISDHLRAMQVRHLLSMSTGHTEDTTRFIVRGDVVNWVQAFLEQPVLRTPGTHFVYNTGATYMLSAILQKVTGIRLLEYLEPRLLRPLGIEDATWELSPQGIHVGGFGLSIKTEDIARFGQLYLQKGMWQGQQLVPEAWIAEATAKHISNGDDPVSDWAQGYGYQFWRCFPNGVYRGDGAFGQYCVVMPEQDAVLTITGGVGDMQTVLTLVWEHLLPALYAPDPLPPDERAQSALQQTLNGLTLPPPSGQPATSQAHPLWGIRYALEANMFGVDGVTFDRADSGYIVTFDNAGGIHPIPCGASVWHEGVTAVFGKDDAIAASAVWRDEETLLLTLRWLETPFFYTLPCRFAATALTIDGTVNVAFEDTHFTLVGRVG